MQVKYLPLVNSLVKTLNRNIERYGFQKAMLSLVKRSRSRLEIAGKDKWTTEVLTKKSVIIIANHPYEAEVIALIAGLPPREDIFLIMNSNFLGISPNLDKHIIPVYIQHHIKEDKEVKISGRLLQRLDHSPRYSPEEEHLRNIQSIDLAIKRIKKGGIVIIFPERRRKSGQWFSGVGHLIKGVGLQKNAYIMRAFIEGTSDLDYFRIVPLFGKLLPKVKLTFAPPLRISEIYNKDPKTITANLRKEYNLWVTRFKKLPTSDTLATINPWALIKKFSQL